MKKLLVILSIAISLSGVLYGQTKIYIEDNWYISFGYTIDSIAIHTDSAYNLCAVRGHIKIGYATTDMLCHSYIKDYIDSTVRITPACNWISYYCQRCRRTWDEQELERREILWRKQ